MARGFAAPDWIAHHARNSPRAVACRDLASGRVHTYAQFHDRVSRLTNALTRRLDAGRGDRILVLSRNDSDVFEIQFACQRSATIFVPLNWRLAVGELQPIVRDAGARVLFYGSEFKDVAQRIESDVPIAFSVEMRAGRPSEYESCLTHESLARSESGPLLEEVWALLYTSGTTGTPKGAQITYGMALCNAVVLGSSFGIGPNSRNLVVLPTFHTGGLNVFANPVFFHGGTNVILRDFDAGFAISVLTDPEFGISHMLGVPTIHEMLAAEPEFARLSSADLRGLCVAGAPCPLALIERYAELGLSLRQCWGMTEVGPLALIMPDAPQVAKYGSSGLSSIFAATMIADAQGKALPAGQVGELLVRGPVVTPGYWRQPQANADSFRQEGWFRTGDAAYRDADGYYFIVDRWKDMFISGGENVYPAEIERVLGLLAGVTESAVVAMPDAKWGEVGRAFVVRDASSAVDEGLLRAHCSSHLARYKVPKEFVFVDALPRNASGKILKTELRKAKGAAAQTRTRSCGGISP
jgi:fatty-acyl-CoA synthase